MSTRPSSPSAQPVMSGNQPNPGAPRAGGSWRNALNSLSVVGALIVLIVIFSVSSPYFLSRDNFYRLLEQAAVVVVLCAGQSLVVFAKGIDVSQGSIVGLASVCGAMVMRSQHSIALGVAVMLAIGVIAGVANGMLIVRAKVVPFIATLAMLSIVGGCALLITDGQPVFGMPQAFGDFGSNGIGVFPWIALIAAAFALLFAFVMGQTRTGRYIYAVGSNENGARIAGIAVGRIVTIAYGLSGLAAGTGAVLLTAYVNTAQPTGNMDLQLQAIAAVVIGGGSLLGGEGTIGCSVAGALLLTVLSNGTQLLGLSSNLQTVLLGFVVLAAVVIDNLRRSARVVR
jgi:ribose transport system permease protein